jgi:hypothetical protein
MALGAIEGAITMCRATASLQPLDDVQTELKVLLAARMLFSSTQSSSTTRESDANTARED